MIRLAVLSALLAVALAGFSSQSRFPSQPSFPSQPEINFNPSPAPRQNIIVLSPRTQAPAPAPLPLPVLPRSFAQAPTDCAYGPWTPYSECSESCGQTGTRSRTRRIIAQAQNGGKACDPSLTEEWEPCFTPCSVDCVMEAWGPWSVCHVSGGQQCGIGRRDRTRGVLVQPQNGGRPCQEREQWETCDAGPCPLDCALGQWSQWSQCPSCGRADRRRERQILISAAFGGRQCDLNSLAEVEACQTRPCAVDCVMGPWGQYSQCQSLNGQNCGQGHRSRQRSIIVHPAFGGRQCEEPQQSEQCDLGPCPVDCVMSQWGQYSQCQSTTGQNCGQGSQSRQRSIIVRAAYGGQQCGETQETESCDLGPCPVNCVMNQWSAWNQCQSNTGRTCGTGSRSRQRSILVQPRFGGRQCDQPEEFSPCDLGPCPVDCIMGQWGPFGECNAPCGSGTKSRFRSIIVSAQYGGRPCERTEDTTICQSKPCFDPPSCIGRPTEFYINPADPCSPNYWKCINQETHAYTCPNGLIFNIETFRCSSRSQVRACF